MEGFSVERDDDLCIYTVYRDGNRVAIIKLGDVYGRNPGKPLFAWHDASMWGYFANDFVKVGGVA